MFKSEAFYHLVFCFPEHFLQVLGTLDGCFSEVKSLEGSFQLHFLSSVATANLPHRPAVAPPAERGPESPGEPEGRSRPAAARWRYVPRDAGGKGSVGAAPGPGQALSARARTRPSRRAATPGSLRRMEFPGTGVSPSRSILPAPGLHVSCPGFYLGARGGDSP